MNTPDHTGDARAALDRVITLHTRETDGDTP